MLISDDVLGQLAYSEAVSLARAHTRCEKHGATITLDRGKLDNTIPSAAIWYNGRWRLIVQTAGQIVRCCSVTDTAQCYNLVEKLDKTQNAETMRDTGGFSVTVFAYLLGHQFGTFCENFESLNIFERYRFLICT